MFRIFVVEVDAALAEELQSALLRYQYEIVFAKCWEDILGEFVKSQAHFLIMNVNLAVFRFCSASYTPFLPCALWVLPTTQYVLQSLGVYACVVGLLFVVTQRRFMQIVMD